jgi:hypothetical protein
MSDSTTTLEYAAPAPRGKSAMITARIAVALIGIALPYLARLPGIFSRGPDWLTSYFGSGPGAFVFFGAFNAINWGAIVLGTLAFRSVPAVFVATIVGFALPIYAHATLDLASDAQAAIGLIFIPIYSLPLVGLGWLLGLGVDWAWCRRSGRAV